MILNKPARSAVKALAATALALAATITVPVSSAQAATGCIRDVDNGAYIFWCHNVYRAPVYKTSTTSSGIVGYMYSTNSWFSCRYDYGGYIGGGHPTRWLFTTADNGAHGMMRDTDIYDETDTVQVCP
ncbi:hypothetical protein G3I60_19405 [Streptomyces sp. SID13666]|uniref:hypothetical protein n=1 Tax=Streptomyces sp. SID13666 TaxID=2706054 RepID=UPI0013C0C032|nr:hypothetical protein [Streptomyces sp. SID13666]NEA56254.1 hypothetical protein [Streptomyces sp. SID13666]